MSVGVLGWLLAAGTLLGCATGGPGNDPSFAVADDQGGSAGAVIGDDASDDSSGNPTEGEGGSAAGVCPNDATHSLEALAAIFTPKPCTSGADCSAGQCCFVGASASTCVMQ